MLKIEKNPNKGKNKGNKVYKLTSNKGYDFDLGKDRVGIFCGIPSKYMNKDGDIVSLVVSKKTTKEGNEKEILGKIVFRNGELKVEKHEADLMNFLDDSPWNKSNKNRDPRKKILFYEYIEEEEKAVEYENITQTVDLMRKILELNGDDLRNIARGFGVNTNQDDKYIQTDLIKISETNPTFEEYMDSNEIKIKTLISKSVELGLIKRHKKIWMWHTDGSGIGSTICSVPTGKDPTEYLINFLMAPDGADVREDLHKSISVLNEKKSNNSEVKSTKKVVEEVD